MKGKKSMIIGLIVITAGIIFHLQGQAILGPKSSFMYSNPQWVTYGIEIILVGVIIAGIGQIFSMIKKTR
ncbi:MAG: hypothetical protein ACKVN8_04865 [Nitrosarchaeum sp.]|nr:hypothetical protein [Nitrosarchaeum sp.]PHY09923.1 MAG: hypothetical protein CK527_00685 [Nitrosarchaeum sp.]